MKENARKGNKKLGRAASVLLIGVLLILAIFLVSGRVINTAFGSTYPDWCGEYKVALSFDEYNLTKQDTLVSSVNGYVSDTAIVKIICGVPKDASVKEIKVRIRTKSGTAVAGVDFTAYDKVVTLRRGNFVNKGAATVFYDSISIKVSKTAERKIVDGQRPYFDVELYDVLTENFSIN